MDSRECLCINNIAGPIPSMRPYSNLPFTQDADLIPCRLPPNTSRDLVKARFLHLVLLTFSLPIALAIPCDYLHASNLPSCQYSTLRELHRQRRSGSARWPTMRPAEASLYKSTLRFCTDIPRSIRGSCSRSTLLAC